MKKVNKNNAETILEKEIKGISFEPIREFTAEALKQYGTEEKAETAKEVHAVMMAMLEKKHLLSANASQAFVDLMVSAALLHNLFYDGTLHSVFMARETLTPLAIGKKVPEQAYKQIFTAIEAQFGDDIDVEACRPNPATPNELFAWAVWFVEEYPADSHKAMPISR